MHTDPNDVDLRGLIDLHVHTAPDVRPRTVDDLEAARQAAAAGMRALVYKSHITCTADRAFIAQKVFPAVTVRGGVTLNDAVGGLNPAAVEAALALGARVVWMPTISARNHVRKIGGKEPGISLLDDDQVQATLLDIFDLVRQHDAILATGHLSATEIVTLVREARAAGVRKVVVTHPEAPWVDLSVAAQLELRDQGAFFERCYVSMLPVGGGVDFARIVADIRQVGVASTLLATDFGASMLPLPVVGMRSYISALLDAGFRERDIRVMAGETPAMLLGLE